MGAYHDLKLQKLARDLYVIEGLTYKEIAKKIGVSEKQVGRWATGDGIDKKDPQFLTWSQQRKQRKLVLMRINTGYTELREALLDKALKTLEPQIINSLARLEKALRSDSETEIPDDISDIDTENIQTPADAIDVLWEAVQKKVGILTAMPSRCSYEAIRDIHNSLALLEKMEEKYPKPEDGENAVPDESRKELVTEVRRILGVRDEQ